MSLANYFGSTNDAHPIHTILQYSESIELASSELLQILVVNEAHVLSKTRPKKRKEKEREREEGRKGGSERERGREKERERERNSNPTIRRTQLLPYCHYRGIDA